MYPWILSPPYIYFFIYIFDRKYNLYYAPAPYSTNVREKGHNFHISQHFTTLPDFDWSNEIFFYFEFLFWFCFYILISYLLRILSHDPIITWACSEVQSPTVARARVQQKNREIKIIQKIKPNINSKYKIKI